jgi:2-keto-4-pentenoate hydratase/2-oxohepta-3-ene-1,7-dioic acid hydratase in catechol pathway
MCLEPGNIGSGLFQIKKYKSMKLLYFRDRDQLQLGVVTGNGVIDIDAYQNRRGRKFFSAGNLTIKDLQEIKSIVATASRLPEFIRNEEDLDIAPCVPRPSKIICIGLNYLTHAIESGMAVPEVPVAFTKYNNTLVEFGESVPLGTEGEQFDYEVELGVIMGEKCKQVKKETALQYVAGYCVANDLSCRDLQFRTSQWLMGKSLDKFLPLGKYFVTADEVGDPQALQLQCIHNGVLRQYSNTRDMIFKVADLISFLSRHMTLEPGDLILTGTPSGVIMGLPEKKWLRPGDTVHVEIEKLGYTTNVMA